jgi:hypothetical protein
VNQERLDECPAVVAFFHRAGCEFSGVQTLLT